MVSLLNRFGILMQSYDSFRNTHISFADKIKNE